MLVPAALGDTTPVYLKMMELPAGMAGMVMPGTSFGELPLGAGLLGVPKVRESTPADTVICEHISHDHNNPVKLDGRHIEPFTMVCSVSSTTFTFVYSMSSKMLLKKQRMPGTSLGYRRHTHAHIAGGEHRQGSAGMEPRRRTSPLMLQGPLPPLKNRIVALQAGNSAKPSDITAMLRRMSRSQGRRRACRRQVSYDDRSSVVSTAEPCLPSTSS